GRHRQYRPIGACCSTPTIHASRAKPAPRSRPSTSFSTRLPGRSGTGSPGRSERWGFGGHVGAPHYMSRHDREGAHGLAADALHGVDDEVAGANKECALLLRVVDRPTLDDPLEDVPVAPDDRERAVVAQLM